MALAAFVVGLICAIVLLPTASALAAFVYAEILNGSTYVRVQ